MDKYPPRPKATREIILKAAADVARELRWPEDSAECIADAYMGYGPDGFRIAKELDRDGWGLSVDDIETLDGMYWKVSRAVNELEKAWFEENDIQPPFEIGTAIKQGVIAGVYDYKPAYYMVREYGCTNYGRHLLVKFEDAQDREGEP